MLTRRRRNPTSPSVADHARPVLAAHTLLAMTSTDVARLLVASVPAETPTEMVTVREAHAATTTTTVLDTDRLPVAGLPTTTHPLVPATKTRIAGTTLLQTRTWQVQPVHRTIVLLPETCLLVMRHTLAKQRTRHAIMIVATGNLFSTLASKGFMV